MTCFMFRYKYGTNGPLQCDRLGVSTHSRAFVVFGPMAPEARRRALSVRSSAIPLAVLTVSLFGWARAGSAESILARPTTLQGEPQDLTSIMSKLQEEAVAAGEEVIVCPVLKEIALEIRPSNIPGAGLGLFLSPSFPLTIPAGCPLTSYGGNLMSYTDVKNFVYALRVGKEADVVMVGNPWNGSVPTSVSGSTPVGHLCNDAAAVLVSDRDFVTRAQNPSQGMGEGEGEASRELQELGVLSMARLNRMVEDYYAETNARANVAFEDTGAEGADLGPCRLEVETLGAAEGGGAAKANANNASAGAAAKRVACVSEAMRRAGGSWVMAALQDIQPGDELYYTYGHRYWLSRCLEADQLQSSLHRVWVERYLAENGDLVESPDGFLYLDKFGRLIDSQTGREAEEDRCGYVMSTRLHWEAQTVGVRTRVMETVGIREGMTNKEALEKLYEYTVDNSL